MEFKVGDFVTYVHALNKKALQIENINCERYYFKNTNLVLAAYEMELWQPKKGEWVVIADDATPDLYAVFQFNNHRRDRPIYPLEFLQTLKD